MLLQPSSLSEQSTTSSTINVHKTAETIVSSIIRHASLYLDERNKINVSTKAQHSQSNANATESFVEFATEFVNNLIQEAQVKVNSLNLSGKVLESESYIKTQLYPKTKEAKDSQQAVLEVATFFMDNVLSEAKRRVDQILLMGVERFRRYSNVDNFKVKDGLEIVARCISRWSFNPHWYFKIIYNGRLVRWSVPSLAFPVAQVTADIYFHIEVIPMTPPPVYIQVCYRLETDRSNRCALKTPFLEKWLHTVIKRKLEAFQMFTF
ncbi:A-kinase anchor protein 14-like isoform X2 [Macrosteles quadrilineatus]|uniref:A-kinase anchor protein 14-like isoform X2 n=1 Tax=Macrosteles quadrilineatus TaxID=74068 RepID=UPI0023E2F511|nr:A-kinase anchor protein 14-like isoform X2 [Macrosteles quadrilineatus]